MKMMLREKIMMVIEERRDGNDAEIKCDEGDERRG